jgi:hypothetical protein
MVLSVYINTMTIAYSFCKEDRACKIFFHDTMLVLLPRNNFAVAQEQTKNETVFWQYAQRLTKCFARLPRFNVS